MKINRYLSPYGGGDCGPPPPNPPCQGPDCPGSGCEPWCDEPCPDGSWPPCDDGPPGGPCTEPCPGNECTGPCCDNGVCICDDCSYDEDGDWHVYWSCASQAEIIILDQMGTYSWNGAPPLSFTVQDQFLAQNVHFNNSQTALEGLEIGDAFSGLNVDNPIVGVQYPNDCYTYLGKKYGSSPATTVANGLIMPEAYWAGVVPNYNTPYNLQVGGCGNCGEDPEPPSESGCMDPMACNYNPEATGMSVDCCFEEGCTDPSAFNYEIGACCDDGSCCYIAGCTDQTACNWDHGVSCFNDGSCCYVSGCMDAAAFDYNSEACCDSGCCYTAGCTDPTATNYDPLACYDDDSCEYCTSTETNSCEINGATNMNEYWNLQNIQSNDHFSWFVDPNNYQIPFGNRYFEIDADDSPCKSEGGGGGYSDGEGGGGGASGTDNPCAGPNNGHYMLITSYEVSVDLQGSGSGTTQTQVVTSWSDAITFLNSPAAANNPIFNENMDWTAVQLYLGEVFQGWNISVVDFTCCECTGGSSCGCTDPLATNYDPNATFDDGSCTYCAYGCTDEACDNYDPNATCDDGSCNCGGEVDESWECDGLSGCYNSGVAGGTYASEADCQSACEGGSAVYGCTDDGSQAAGTSFGSLTRPTATSGHQQQFGGSPWVAISDSAINYNPLATIDDSSCIWCTWSTLPTHCVTHGICPDSTGYAVDYNNSNFMSSLSTTGAVGSLTVWLKPNGGDIAATQITGGSHFFGGFSSMTRNTSYVDDGGGGHLASAGWTEWSITLAASDYWLQDGAPQNSISSITLRIYPLDASSSTTTVSCVSFLTLENLT